MGKYLFQGSYTAEGTSGLLRDGGTKRRAAVEQLAKDMGGRLESFYFAFGETDTFVIVDLPDNVSSSAISLAINARGAVQVKTTALVTPEEMDQATKKSVDYRPPGQ